MKNYIGQSQKEIIVNFTQIDVATHIAVKIFLVIHKNTLHYTFKMEDWNHKKIFISRIGNDYLSINESQIVSLAKNLAIDMHKDVYDVSNIPILWTGITGRTRTQTLNDNGIYSGVW